MSLLSSALKEKLAFILKILLTINRFTKFSVLIVAKCEYDRISLYDHAIQNVSTINVES